MLPVAPVRKLRYSLPVVVDEPPRPGRCRIAGAVARRADSGTSYSRSAESVMIDMTCSTNF